MTELPCPRLELRWEPIRSVVMRHVNISGRIRHVNIRRGIRARMYDWKCTYSLVIPLNPCDIRREEFGPQMRLKIQETRAEKFGQKPIDRNGNVEVPFRDVHHSEWDREALGGHLPVVAICEDTVTIIKQEQTA